MIKTNMPPTLQQIREILVAKDERGNRAVEEAILRIHARQTSDEQRSHDTRHRNGRGFNVAHAARGTKFAEWIIGMRKNGAEPGKAFKNPSKLDEARQLALCYVKQLHEDAITKFDRRAKSATPVQSQCVDVRIRSGIELDPDELDDAIAIQQNERAESARVARFKLERDRRLAVVEPTPGSIVSFDQTNAVFAFTNKTDSALSCSVRVTSTSGIVIMSTRLTDHTLVSLLAVGNNMLWFRTEDIEVT